MRILRDSVKVHGKRVLIRIVGNVPIKNGRAVDIGRHGKLARAAVDLEWLRQRGAKVIIATHLGRPEGRKIGAYSVKPVARRLSELLGVKIKTIEAVTGTRVEKQVEQMKEGDLIMLENVRFDAREERNSPAFAHELATFSDMYVNDAFAVTHRSHATVDAIAFELPAYAGPQLVQEVTVLQKVLHHPRHPFTLVIGGAKMATKLPVLNQLLPHADNVLVGGALAHAFLRARGVSLGASYVEESSVQIAKRLLRTYGEKIQLPFDVLVANSWRNSAKIRYTSVDAIGSSERIVDIGRASARQFSRSIQTSKMIVWNGPLGFCERPNFCKGTELIARAIATRSGKATTVVGGGDTIPIIERLDLSDRYTLVSTGGGAMLEFLSGILLPGLEALGYT